MALRETELITPHFVKYTTGNDLLAYTLTGVAGCLHKGTGQGYHHDTLTVVVPIPDLPDGKGLHLVHWAPFVTVASVSNDGEGDNVAWAVDWFRLTNASMVMREASVECQLAVRDIDGFILRVAYTVHLLGRLADIDNRPR